MATKRGLPVGYGEADVSVVVSGRLTSMAEDVLTFLGKLIGRDLSKVVAESMPEMNFDHYVVIIVSWRPKRG